ncbi:MAG: serine hydrolase domain-containing protein [Xanthobacteraceae bacterium]|jgi:CubicO group peptidase (beta-lactamase class C family)
MTAKPQSRRHVLKSAAVISAAASFGEIWSTAAGAATDAVKKAAQTGIDQVLRQAAETRDVAGVVAMAATEDGVLYQGAFGKRDLAKGSDMTLDSVFWIASMTKAITATAAMQLVEQGKLQLEQPMGALLPQLAAPQVLEGFDGNGEPKLRPAKRPITLRHLLTHTAGFTYDIWDINTGRYAKYAKLPGIISCKNAALTTPLAFDPGDGWEYGINIDFVGKAVEAVSGQSLNVYLHDHIFAPLGMTDTAFVIGPDQRTRLVSVHARKPDGSLEPIEFGVPQEPEFFMGGGGLYGTARDYLAYLQMLLNGGKLNGAQVLRPETVALMSQNHIGALNVPGLWKTAAPDASLDVDLASAFGPDLKWGLSFLINTRQGPSGRAPGSLTWAGLANTYFWLDPARRVAGVILTQSLPFVDPRAVKLYGQFESGVYKALSAS